MTGKFLLAIFFIIAGTLHFIFPRPYLKIMPPMLPTPRLLVIVSGAAEIAGGFGLLFSQTSRPAAWGLVFLLIAVFPANVYMAVAHLPFPGMLGKSWAQWLRLPLQIPLIWWALRYTRPH